MGRPAARARQGPRLAIRLGIRTAPGDPRTHGESATDLPQTLAVIDFRNLTRRAEDDWIGSGIAESLSADLTRVPGLTVVAREKVLRTIASLRDAAHPTAIPDVLEVAGVLGCRWVLSGGFQSLGSVVRITTTLTEVATGQAVAAEKLDGTLDGIFDMQDRLSKVVVASLNLRLPTPVPLGDGARDVQAFEYYARGRRLWQRLEKGTFDQARELYERAAGSRVLLHRRVFHASISRFRRAIWDFRTLNPAPCRATGSPRSLRFEGFGAAGHAIPEAAGTALFGGNFSGVRCALYSSSMWTRPLLLICAPLIVAAFLQHHPTAERTAAQAVAADETVPLSHYQDLRWRNVGPTRGGRVTAIAGVRTQLCTFYMGATGGGVWKTEDCGDRWVPITDGRIATGSIGSIDVSDSNPDIVWVGTGSAAIRSNVIIGRGVYKSTDAGKTWQFMGLKDSGQIGSLAIHPTNSDVVWLAALGSPFGPNPERGIFKTTDGGKTWRKTLFVNEETGGRVVAVNHSNPDELYAGMYRGFRKGWDIVSGGPASEGGIYKSTDGGESWTKLSHGLPQTLIGKIDIDIARSNPRAVYAMVEAPDEEGGLYKSEDSGATWRLVNNSAGIRARPFYFHYVDVNPKNEHDIWVGAVQQYRSTDGGRTFETLSTPHADNHGIWFNPDNPDYAVQGNDGGANVTRDGGRTWSSILNQPTAELYMVSVDEQYPYLLYGPQQDNSTLVVPSVPNQPFGFDHPAQAWTQASGCETGGIWPTPDGKIIWGACKGEVERFNVETGQSQGKWIYPQNRYGHHPREIQFRFPRQTVVVVSRHDPKVVYQASHVLHRSVDDGVTWEVISPDLTANEPEYQIVPGNPITRDVTGEEVYSTIYSMDESSVEAGVIWIGANDGPVHVTRDNGKSWRNVTPKDLPPGGRVQNIGASPLRKGSAYIAVYRFLREHDLSPYIYATDDYGATWRKLTDGTNGIPADHPTRVVREDPEQQGLLYAGTEFGLFVSFDNGHRWQALQQNLPVTPVTDLRVHRGDLVISTMGRSFWIMDDVGLLRQLARARGSASTPSAVRPGGVADSRGRPAVGGTLVVPVGGTQRAALDLARPTLLQPADAIRYRRSGGGRGSGVPQYPPVAMAIDYILPEGFSGPVSLEIRDSSDRVVRTFQPAAVAGRGRGRGAADDEPQDPDMRLAGRGRGGPVSLTTRGGHNRFLWDFRWDGNVMAAPGRFTVKMSAGDVVALRTFEVKADPGVLKDGLTVADLVEQQNFLLRVRDAQIEAHQLQQRLQRIMQEAGVSVPRSPGPGEWVGGMTFEHPLQALWARLVTASGTYQQGMLIDQLSNIMRAEGGADQKVGAESRRRLDDLLQELNSIQRELPR